MVSNKFLGGLNLFYMATTLAPIPTTTTYHTYPPHHTTPYHTLPTSPHRTTLLPHLPYQAHPPHIHPIPLHSIPPNPTTPHHTTPITTPTSSHTTPHPFYSNPSHPTPTIPLLSLPFPYPTPPLSYYTWPFPNLAHHTSSILYFMYLTTPTPTPLTHLHKQLHPSHPIHYLPQAEFRKATVSYGTLVYLYLVVIVSRRSARTSASFFSSAYLQSNYRYPL